MSLVTADLFGRPMRGSVRSVILDGIRDPDDLRELSQSGPDRPVR